MLLDVKYGDWIEYFSFAEHIHSGTQEVKFARNPGKFAFWIFNRNRLAEVGPFYQISIQSVIFFFSKFNLLLSCNILKHILQ